MPVRNQKYLRKRNKESILGLLRQHTQSYSDLARELKLSNTAIANIVDDLIEQNIVKRENETLGRGGIDLSINGGLGYVIAIDMSGRFLHISAADFGSNMIETRESEEVLSFTRTDLENLMETVDEIRHSPSLAGKRLFCISIACPGKIDKQSGKFILNPRFIGFDDISMHDVFAERFSCEVLVGNDINAALAGEKRYGSILKGKSNALMIHIDVGMGAAVMIDNKIYEGDHGFAGEIGYLKLNTMLIDGSFGNYNYANYYDSLAMYAWPSVVEREIQRGGQSVLAAGRENDSPVTIEEVIRAYTCGDGLVRGVVDSAARVIGTVVHNISDFLDIDTVVLNGAVSGLGPDFLEVVNRYALRTRMTYSEMGNKATIYGAVNAGIHESLLRML